MKTGFLLAFALIIASASAWMDPSWQYRTPITVSNGGSALVDYQVSVTLNTNALILAGKMRSDCGDLRFTTSADAALSYWIESGCNTASTKVWVKDASIPAGSSTVYAYYGNPGATGTGSPSSVYLAYDDFPGTSLSPNWNSAGLCVSVSGSAATVTTCGVNAYKALVWSAATFTDTLIEARERGTTGVHRTKGSFARKAASSTDLTSAYYVYSEDTWHGIVAPSGTIIVTGPAVSGEGGQWFITKFYAYGTNFRSEIYDDSLNLLSTRTATNSERTTAGYAGLDVIWGDKTYVFDWFRVRKYASPEPTTATQPEEVRPTQVFMGISPSNKSAYPNTNETFSLWVFSNQTSADSIALSCSGTCYYSENPVAAAAGQNKSVNVTITSAGASGTTLYTITAVSQSNHLNNATATASITVDATTWRSQWTDAFNNTYAYRTPITATNNGSALTDYQVPINLTSLVYNNSGLVGSWHFSESSGTRFADSSGNGNDGTYNGETLNSGTLTNFNFNANSGWVDGKYGKALQFDGMDDYLDAGNGASLSFGAGSFTVEAWVRTADAGNYKTIVSKGASNSGATARYYMRVEASTGKFHASIADGTNEANIGGTRTGLNDNAWHHLAMVVDRSTQTMATYVDGVQDSNISITPIGNINSAQSLRLGILGTQGYYFKGGMDGVRIYSRALSPTEIAQVYQNNTFLRNGLAGYWRFDENAGAVAQDTHHVATQDNRDGAKAGNSLSFDGANDYVSVPDNAAWNFGSNDFTIDTWVKFNNLANTYYHIYNQQQSGSEESIYWWQSGVNTLYFRVNSGGATLINHVVPWTPSIGVWYNLVLVRNGNTFTTYINGVQQGASTVDADGVPNYAAALTLGGYGPGTYSFNGTIDEVRVYNRSLSAQEIQQLYSATKLRPDYADLRFTNSSYSQLPYWLESDNLAWVRMPYVPNGTSTVYAYYGSPGVQSAASGNATFNFFDDFPGSSLSPAWTTGGSASVSNGIATLGTATTVIYTGLNYNAGLALRSKEKRYQPAVSDGNHETQTSFQDGTIMNAWDTANNVVGYSYDSPGRGLRLFSRKSPTTYSGTDSWLFDGGANWHTSEITWSSNLVKWTWDNTVVGSSSDTASIPTSTLRASFGTYTHLQQVDWVAVRKYASPEPSGALLLEESANPAAILSILPAGKTAYPNYNETFTLWVYNNQTVSDTFTLSCAGTCSISPSSLPLTAYQNGSATVTVTSANVSGTTNYRITAISQANASNSASIYASITVDATKWRDQWTDAHNNGFRYRVPITINNGGSGLTDYQVNVTIDTATPIGLSRMRSDCGDLRLTNGTNELPYWIESGCNNASTRIWARVPHVHAGNSTIYAYYGNAALTNASSGTATFEVFDEFDSLGSWVQQTGGWSVANGKLTAADSSSWYILRYNKPLSGNTAYAINLKFLLRPDTLGGQSDTRLFTFTNGQSPLDSSASYANTFYARGAAGAQQLNRLYWDYGDGIYGTISPFYSGNWYIGEVAVSAAANRMELFYPNRTSLGSFSRALSTKAGTNIGLGEVYGPYDVDWLFVRRYSPTAPLALAGAERSKGYVTLVRRCGLAQANATVTAYQAGNITGSCLSDGNGICTLEVGAGTYDLQFMFADNSAAWKNGTAFG